MFDKINKIFVKENKVETKQDINNESESFRRLNYDEISFIYDSVVRTAIETLFAQKDKHGWTEQEFNDMTTAIIMAEQEKLINRWVN